MNIFALEYRQPNETLQSYTQRIAASHCDQHQKLCLEQWQMLNTNCNVLGIDVPNKSKAYVNHPCTQFVRQSLGNWQFCIELCYALAIDFADRYNKEDLHKSALRVSEEVPYDALGKLSGGLTEFAMAMPESFKKRFKDDPVTAYREYYMTHKAFFTRKDRKNPGKYLIQRAKWTNKSKPSWYKEISLDEALSKGYITVNDDKGKRIVVSDKNIFTNI